MHILSVQINKLEKHGWTLERSKNMFKSWETSTRQVIGVGLQDKKSNIKAGRFKFYEP
jgi:hypothetical protein